MKFGCRVPRKFPCISREENKIFIKNKSQGVQSAILFLNTSEGINKFFVNNQSFWLSIERFFGWKSEGVSQGRKKLKIQV